MRDTVSICFDLATGMLKVTPAQADCWTQIFGLVVAVGATRRYIATMVVPWL
jgi:hypothetical protein